MIHEKCFWKSITLRQKNVKAHITQLTHDKDKKEKKKKTLKKRRDAAN